MNSSDKPAGISANGSGGAAGSFTDTSFSDVVQETCERLKEKHIQYSIRRIHEMENTLNSLESELTQFLLTKSLMQRYTHEKPVDTALVHPEKK